MPTRLTKYEMETIIIFNEEEKEARCYTCNKSLMNRLDDFCSKSSEITRVAEDEHGQTYVMPKKWIKVRMPKEISEEERQKMRERARERFWGTERRDNNASAEN